MVDNDEKDVHLSLLRDVLSGIQGTNKSIETLQGKFNLHEQAMQYELKGIKDTNEIQNKILEEHHKRSDALQKDNELREEALRNQLFGKDGEIPKINSRLEKAEQPRKFVETVKGIFITSGTIAASILGLIKLLEVLKILK